MASWNHLSKETRQEIIKRLDFRTRFRFRHVSKTNQFLVDSVPLYIPRVVVDGRNENNVELTVYLGIEKKIVMEFEKKKKNEIGLKVSRSDEAQIEKLVKFKNAIIPAFRALKHITMHSKTLLGGLEFRNMNTMPGSMPQVQMILGNALFRTKVLCLAASEIYMFCIRCSPEDLLEHQTAPFRPKWTQLITYTDSVEYRLAKKDLKKWEDDEKMPAFMDQEYIHTGYKNVMDYFHPGDFQRFINAKGTEMNGPNDFTSKVICPDGDSLHIRFTSCGATSRHAEPKFEKLTEEDCEMRWTCAKHADPFEHWYYTTVMFKPKPWDRRTGCYKIRNKPFYDEQINPIVNGKSLLKEMVEKTRAIWKMLGGRVPTGVKDVEPVIIVEKLEKIDKEHSEIQEITGQITNL